MKRIAFLILFVIAACNIKNRNNFHSVFHSEKDTVLSRLRGLSDSLLTKIEVTPLVRIFDSVNEGSVLVAKYNLLNFGAMPLTIAQTIVSCDCTTPIEDAPIILSGENKEIEFLVNTSGFQKGYNERTITILGNFKPFYRVLRVEVYIK